MKKFKKITPFSNCDEYKGTDLKCPKCNTLTKIYHLSWESLCCQNCEVMIDKYKWFIKNND